MSLFAVIPGTDLSPEDSCLGGLLSVLLQMLGGQKISPDFDDNNQETVNTVSL